jgi:tetratricopeptide (TPR) repeat protein
MAGRTAESLHPLEKAIEEIEKQKKIYGMAYNNYSSALIRIGRGQEALPFAEKAVKLEPELAEAYYNLGNALVGVQRFNEALENYAKAVSKKKGYAEAYHNLALMYANKGQITKAIENDRMALRIKPKYAAAAQTLQHWVKVQEQAASASPGTTFGIPAVTLPSAQQSDSSLKER